MKKITMIRLIDGSIHETKQQAERHLTNILCSGLCLDTFEKMARKNVTELRSFFVENSAQIEQTMQIVRELNEVMSLNDR